MATQPTGTTPVKKPMKTTPPDVGESLWAIAWRRLRKNRLAMFGMYVLILFSLLAIFAPYLGQHRFDAVNMLTVEQRPSREYLLGTDDLGRDVLSRLLMGGRISLTVGLVAEGITVTIGILLGAISGYYGGWVDNVIMRFTDIVLTIPFLPMALTMAVVLKPSVYNTMIILGLLGWTGLARLVRGEFLSLRQRDFVEAAKAAGGGDRRIIFRHLLPNSMAPIIVSCTLGVAGAIGGEAALSFLGFGVQQPTPSWGNMLSSALSLKVLIMQPWLWIPPGMMIFISVLAVNLLGQGLRDAMDPRLKQ